MGVPEYFEQKLDFGTMKGKVDEIGSPSSQADSERRSRMLDGMSSVAVEHEERMNGLEDMFEASERKQAEARNAAAERLNEERVGRQQREIDAERQQERMRQDDARRNPVVPEFPFEGINRNQGQAMIAVGVATAIPPALATIPTIISTPLGVNGQQFIYRCVIIASACNSLQTPFKRTLPKATDINRAAQMERLKRSGDELRKLNEYLRNVPTQVK